MWSSHLVMKLRHSCGLAERASDGFCEVIHRHARTRSPSLFYTFGSSVQSVMLSKIEVAAAAIRGSSFCHLCLSPCERNSSETLSPSVNLC
jgi:hypothetical protein